MPTSGIFHPDQIAMLRRVLDDVCAGITNEATRADMATLALELFRSGSECPEELARQLRTHAARLRAPALL